jgi:hypothetical protein
MIIEQYIFILSIIKIYRVELRKMKIEKAQGTIHLTGFNKNFVNEVLLD